MRITVILDDDEAETFNAYCENQGFKKSTLIKRLIKEHIRNEGFEHQKNLFEDNSKSREENGRE